LIGFPLKAGIKTGKIGAAMHHASDKKDFYAEKRWPLFILRKQISRSSTLAETLPDLPQHQLPEPAAGGGRAAADR
jgi:hypothetical protein